MGPAYSNPCMVEEASPKSKEHIASCRREICMAHLKPPHADLKVHKRSSDVDQKHLGEREICGLQQSTWRVIVTKLSIYQTNII